MPAQAYQTAMEDLGKLLQDTGSSVDCILSKYTASSAQFLGPKFLEVRTSLSMGAAPAVQNSRQEAQTNIPCQDGLSVSILGPTQLQASSSNNVYIHGLKNLYSQKQVNHLRHEETFVGKDVLASNDKAAFADEDALKILLEEIKKTICNWSSRRKTLLQDGPSRGAAHDGVAFSSGFRLPNGAPSLLGSEEEQSPAIYISSSGATKSGENQIEVHSSRTEEEERCGDVNQAQNEEGKNGEIVHQNQNEKENRGGLLPRQDKEAGKDIASQLQSDEQPTTVHLAAREQESSAQVDTEVNVAATPLPKENQPAAVSLLTPTSTGQTEAKLPITKWTPPTSAAKMVNKSVSFLRAVEVITSPDWLPEGWVTELKTRGSGNSAGSKDKYYVDPISHRRFRSRKEVVAYLERGKWKSSDDSPETSPVKKFPAPELLPSFPSNSSKKAKLKESVTPSASALPPPMVPSMTSPGLLGNVFMPPFRTGQPSEWLVYESLASLPFPMFDPFYYTEFNANKSNSGKGSHVPTRPWFFTGPEASWNPFMDRPTSLSKSSDKGRDYSSYFSMPSYPSEVASNPSAGGAKKSAKRKSAGL